MREGIRRGSWWITLLVTLGGIGSSIYLTREHFIILKSGFGDSALCNIGSYINCNTILMSRWAEIGTFPLGGLGLLFYIYVLGALIHSRIEQKSAAKILFLPYLLTILSFFLTLFLAYISVFELHALCLFCSSLYFVSLFSLIFMKRTIPMSLGDWFRTFSKVPWLRKFAYLSVTFIVGGILLYTGQRNFAKDFSQEIIKKHLDEFFQKPEREVDVSGHPFYGNKDAKIIIAEFSDFECGYCQRAAFILKSTLAPYKDKIKLVFMHFPLDKACNFMLPREFHRNSCEASYATYCAGKQGKFWEYHDEAFRRQPKFYQASLENISEKLKLDLPQFKACLNSEETKKEIQADVEQGIRLGLHGTPAFFVNGRLFDLWPSRKAWRQLMERLLEENQKRQASE